MNQTIQCACALCQMRIVGILGPNPIEDEIQTIGEVRNASPEAVEIEAIFDVGTFDLAKHFVALETAEPDGVEY